MKMCLKVHFQFGNPFVTEMAMGDFILKDCPSLESLYIIIFNDLFRKAL